MDTGIVIFTTGTGETAEIASATKCEPTQTSSTGSKALEKRSGNSLVSHHHRPMVYRSKKNPGPAWSANVGSMSAFTQMRLTGKVGLIVSVSYSCSWRLAEAERPTVATGMSALSSAATTCLAVSPTPSSARKYPATLTPTVVSDICGSSSPSCSAEGCTG